jgi:two-component system phosphate regulon sensor histidine kinase PhoR
LRSFWKLGLSYLALLLLAFVAVHLYTLSRWQRSSREAAYEHLDSIARLAESRPPSSMDRDSLSAWAEWISEGGVRVTIVGPDGTVMADSDEDPVRMENHGDRPEVKSAWVEGRGRATRLSSSVRQDLAYLAIRVSWATTGPVVLRLALPLRTVNLAAGEIHAPLAAILVLALAIGGAVALIMSRRFSERVIRLKSSLQRVAEGDFRTEPVVDSGDEIAELHGSLNQAVERLSLAMRFLEEERNQSAAILSSMSEGVAVVDRDERIRYSNPAFRRALHSGREPTFEGRRLVEVTRQSEILAMVQGVLKGGERMEAEIATAALKPRHFLVRAAPAGETGAVLVVLDITEIRRLERVRRDFVANVSHELRTPLTAIQGFAETLLRGALDEPENSRRFVEIIRDHAVRLARLTEDLLKLSRIEAGKLELELRPISVESVVEQCVETARLTLSEKRQSLTVSLCEAAPLVKADTHALLDVLRNLLDNAIQYTPEDGHVAIRVFLAGAEGAGEVRIAVEDDGIGIPASSHDRIFERFYRVDAARSRKVGGTGLGLSISKHLVEGMGGRIELESQLGRGSTFTVVLPRVKGVGMKTLVELLSDMEELGEREAVVYHDGLRTRKWSYGELLRAIAGVAEELTSRGLTPGDRLLLWGENRPEWVAVFWAAVLRRFTLVPVDFRSSRAFVSRVQKDVGAKLLIHGASVDTEGLDLPSVDFEAVSRMRSDARLTLEGVDPEDVVQVIYTSGTTGEPKGVVHRHRHLAPNLRPIRREIRKYGGLARPFQPIRFLDLLPLSHVFGQFAGLYVPVLMGGSVVFLKEVHPGAIIETIRRERVSVLISVPRFLESLRREIERRVDRSRPHRSPGLWGGLAVSSATATSTPRSASSSGRSFPVERVSRRERRNSGTGWDSSSSRAMA